MACAFASLVGYGASVLATPSGDLDGGWLRAKAQGAAVGAGAFAATAGVTSGLKSLTSRERPDGSDDNSLPSGHASTAAVFGTMTVRNLQGIDLSPALRTTLEIGAGAMTAAPRGPASRRAGTIRLTSWSASRSATSWVRSSPRRSSGSSPARASPSARRRCAGCFGAVGHALLT